MTKDSELESLLNFLGIAHNLWNLLLLGDGSGSLPTKPGGWACFGVEQTFDENGQSTIKYHEPVFGAVSCGPINWLETLPYWHFVRQHYYYMGGKEQCLTGKVIVHIVTDSQWAARAMSGHARAKYHRDMATMFAAFQDWGYQLHWHHVSRETILLQSLADRLSAQAREYLSAVEAPQEFWDMSQVSNSTS